VYSTANVDEIIEGLVFHLNAFRQDVALEGLTITMLINIVECLLSAVSKFKTIIMETPKKGDMQ